jgi:cytochrome P450
MAEAIHETSQPADPVKAVTHADPYLYYARLALEQPFYRDPNLGMWVASSADAVTAVLTHEACRVRPVTEPIPKALLGSPAGEIFGALVRMNDGRDHCPFKQAILAALVGIDEESVAQRSRRWGQYLAAELRPMADHRRLSEFALRLPVYVMADLLGIPEDRLAEAASCIAAFVQCLSPLSTATQIEDAKSAAGQLLDLVGSLSQSGRLSAESLLFALNREATRAGPFERKIVLANAIGFMSQAYEATAGLIGNTLLVLARDAELRDSISVGPELLHATVAEVLRFDPPVQNTRRFLSKVGNVFGVEVAEGDTILVVLAAANRDPSANPDPDRFDICRTDRRIFTFSDGSHRCPGVMIAATIAASGVAELLHAGLTPSSLGPTVTYRPSVNGRIPLFHNGRHP